MSDQDTPPSSDSSAVSPRTDKLPATPAINAAQRSWYRDRFFLTFVVALLTAGGYISTAYIQANGTLDVERERFRAQLVLQAIDVKDKQERRENLMFLLKTGLLQDKDGKLTTVVSDQKDIPRISAGGINWVDIEGKPIPRRQAVNPGALQ